MLFHLSAKGDNENGGGVVIRKRILSTNLQSKEGLGGKEEATQYAWGTDVR